MARAPTPMTHLRGLLALSLLSTALVASAQTIAYTAKELKRPTGYGVSACDHEMDSGLSDSGDVATLCSYRNGYFFDASIGFGLIPLPKSAFRPVVWRNGGTPVLPAMASGTEIKVVMGVDGRGRVLGRVGPIPPSKGSYDVKQETLTWWEGSQRSSWKSPVADLAYNWAVSNVTNSGQFAAMTNSGAAGPRVIVINGSTVRDIPLPPGVGRAMGEQALLASSYSRNLVMNDKGQLALLTRVISTDSTYDPAVAWFWNGSQWSQIPTGGVSLVVQNINANGVVHLTGMPYVNDDTRLQRYLWQEGGSLNKLSDEAYGSFSTPKSSVADNGDVVGVAVLPSVSSLPNIGQQRAIVLRNGQQLDLNKLSTPPSGHTYLSVLAENAKGQLLARSLNTANSTTSTPRWWLLTPK
jgi:hypothetical protein